MRFSNAPSYHVEPAFQVLGAPAARSGDQHLGDGWHGGESHFTQHFGVDRHITPAGDGEGFSLQLVIDDLDGAFLFLQKVKTPVF